VRSVTVVSSVAGTTRSLPARSSSHDPSRDLEPSGEHPRMSLMFTFHRGSGWLGDGAPTELWRAVIDEEIAPALTGSLN